MEEYKIEIPDDEGYGAVESTTAQFINKYIITIKWEYPVYEIRAPHDFEGYATEIGVIVRSPFTDNIVRKAFQTKEFAELKKITTIVHYSNNGYGEF